MANEKTTVRTRISPSLKSPQTMPGGAEDSEYPLTPANFKLMAIAGAAIVIGFLLMLGPKSTPDAFEPDIFSARRIVLGPALSFLGFVAMGFAIIYKPKGKTDKQVTAEKKDGLD